MYKHEDTDEFAADELEAGQYTYEVEARRNQFPQEDTKKQEDIKKHEGCGGACNTCSAHQPYEHLAEYTMIYNPDEDEDVVGMNQS